MKRQIIREKIRFLFSLKLVLGLFLIPILSGCWYEKVPRFVAPLFDVDSTAYYDSIFSDQAEIIDEYFTLEHRKTIFYGNVLFADHGNIIFQKSYGYNKKTKHDPVTIDHTFQLASASKTFTAVATLMLYERGEIQLTDSVQQYISNFPYENITIHDLLSHRSGLGHYTHFCDNPDSIWSNKDSTIHNFEVLQIMDALRPPLATTPGKRFYYSNTNYMLLASIIEEVTGICFSQFLSDNIFLPCEMKSTVLYERDNKSSLNLPTRAYEGNFREATDMYLNGCVGDKGIYSNVADMLKFDQALYGNLLLSDTCLALAFNGKSKPDKYDNNKNYGYGFRSFDMPGVGKVVYHNGWWNSCRSYFIRVVDRQQTIVILSNVKRGPFFKVTDLINFLPTSTE